MLAKHYHEACEEMQIDEGRYQEFYQAQVTLNHVNLWYGTRLWHVVQNLIYLVVNFK